MRNRLPVRWFIVFGLVGLVAIVILFLPPVRDRLIWRLSSLRAQIQRSINPPQEIVFVPEGQTLDGTDLSTQLAPEDFSSTPQPAVAVTASPTAQITSSKTPQLTATPLPSLTPTYTTTPLPVDILLTGLVHEYQQFNNCGPANLSMALSYWGWTGNQNDTRAFLRPNREVDDKNVMPGEMVAFVEEYTEFKALARVGGDLEMLKRLIAAGFPVLIEKGHHPEDDWWMGHYVVVNGYDDQRQRFTIQDSLIAPDLSLAYADLEAHEWRDFNYVYIVIYPPDRQDQVYALLGQHVDSKVNYQFAAQKALDEMANLSGRDLFFAWFNLGSSQVGLEDYAAAAMAYDQAFQLYQGLSEEQRPYRLMWYQIGPYMAYFYAGRYQDVVNLANTTFNWVGQPVLEESYYWRGLAYEALGDLDKAIADLKKAAQLNPNYLLPGEQLQRLGIEQP